MLLLDVIFFPFLFIVHFESDGGGGGDPQMDGVLLYAVEMWQKGRKGEQNRHHCCFKDIPFDVERQKAQSGRTKVKWRRSRAVAHVDYKHAE